MNAPDDFEARLRDWLRDRGLTSDDDLRALAGNVAVLPPRRPNRWRPAMVAAIVILGVALGIALVPRFGGVGGGPADPTSPQPPDPAAFAGDPRFASCGGLAARVTHAFELPRARDYRLHLPAMGLSPELDVDAPAFVVVFEGASPFISSGGAGPRVTNAPGHRDLCILVAEPDGTATRNLYTDVDIGGLTASGEGTRGPTAAPGERPTAEPPPAWANDLLGQLQCDGDPQPIGHERGEAPGVGQTGTASPHSWLDLRDDVDLPFSGWVEEPLTSWENGQSHYVRYVNSVGGEVKALILMLGTSVDGGQGNWAIAAFRACAPDEFDPLRGRTLDDAIWTDPRGGLSRDVRTIIGPGHCGWESTTWLFRGDALFIRDPLGLFADATVGAFEADVPLPADATATGFRSPRWELFTTADPDSVLVRSDHGVERWPRAQGSPSGLHVIRFRRRRAPRWAPNPGLAPRARGRPP